MIKTRITLLIFLLIMVQSSLAITAGVAVLFGTSSQVVPSGIFAGDLPIGGMSYPEAAKAIEADYTDKFKLKSLLLDVENAETYEIPFSQIDAEVDGNATIQPLKVFKGVGDIPAIFNTYFGHSKQVLRPAVKFNEGKLRLMLLELSKKVNVAPVDAVISYKDGIIEKKAETNGIALNITNAVDVIKNGLSTDTERTVRLDRTGNFELQTVDSSKKIKEYDEIQHVISEYTTIIADEELSDSIRLAADTINGVILPAAGDKDNLAVFSFVECLATKNADFENDSEGYDQVASTLYAALLSAGMPVDSITRLPHKLSVDYIEPGLDAWISGSTGDLKFFNPFSHKIAIFAQVEDNKVKVVIAGNLSDKKGKSEIKTEIVQKFAPPVYNVENKSLKQGERIVLNPGKEGVMVKVFRDGELIGTDTYEAEKTIVQIGPDTDWKNGGK